MSDSGKLKTNTQPQTQSHTLTHNFNNFAAYLGISVIGTQKRCPISVDIGTLWIIFFGKKLIFRYLIFVLILPFILMIF